MLRYKSKYITDYNILSVNWQNNSCLVILYIQNEKGIKMRILPIFFAKNNTNINKTTLKKENNSSTTPIKNSYTEYFSYQDYNINFKARLNRTPEPQKIFMNKNSILKICLLL